MERLEAPREACAEEPAQVAARLFEDACASACGLAGKVEREVHLIGSGLIGGAAEEIKKDPVKAGVQVGATAVIGTVLTAAAIAEAPVILTGLALGAGAVATGKWLYDTFDPTNPENQKRNQAIAGAVVETWNKSDERIFQKNEKLMQSNLGTLGLDLGSALVGGGTAAKFAPALAAEISVGCKAFSGAARGLGSEVTQLLKPRSLECVPVGLVGLEKGPSISHLSKLHDRVNFSKAAPKNEPAVPKEQLPAAPKEGKDASVKAVEPVEQTQAITRKPSGEADFEQVNRIQKETFPHDELSELGVPSAENIIVLDRPGHGVVGYAYMGMLDEPTLLYMAVLPEHRASSKFLIKAVLDACRTAGQWWFAYLKEDTAHPLFKSLAQDGYIKMKSAGEVDIHPRTGDKHFPVRFKVTNKEFTGIRKPSRKSSQPGTLSIPPIWLVLPPSLTSLAGAPESDGRSH